jgi:hypothetical protein
MTVDTQVLNQQVFDAVVKEYDKYWEAYWVRKEDSDAGIDRCIECHAGGRRRRAHLSRRSQCGYGSPPQILREGLVQEVMHYECPGGAMTYQHDVAAGAADDVGGHVGDALPRLVKWFPARNGRRGRVLQATTHGITEGGLVLNEGITRRFPQCWHWLNHGVGELLSGGQRFAFVGAEPGCFSSCAGQAGPECRDVGETSRVESPLSRWGSWVDQWAAVTH